MTETDPNIWSSLPVPAILIDEDDRIADLNPAAEGFMNNSSKWLTGQPIWDRLAVDAPLEESFVRARSQGTPLFVNDVDVGTGARPPLVCNLQIAPLSGRPGWMVMLISPRELAGRMTQSQSVKSAAKSAIGMAEMLAHEIKNPLAGITGAAQLLSMNSIPSSRGGRTAPVWGWRWSARSSRTMTAGFPSTAFRARRFFAFRCRGHLRRQRRAARWMARFWSPMTTARSARF